MHLRREVDGKLDELIAQINELNKKKDGESNNESVSRTLAIENLKDEITKLTNSGERAKGLWTDAPEFTYPNIFTNN